MRDLEERERENDRKMPLEFHLDKMGSPIVTWTNKGTIWTNKGQSLICPNEMLDKCHFYPSLKQKDPSSSSSNSSSTPKKVVHIDHSSQREEWKG